MDVFLIIAGVCYCISGFIEFRRKEELREKIQRQTEQLEKLQDALDSRKEQNEDKE